MSYVIDIEVIRSHLKAKQGARCLCGKEFDKHNANQLTNCWPNASAEIAIDREVSVLHDKIDNVNHPSHYTSYKGVEIIDLTEQMNFNRGNAVKYICRAGLKDPATEVEDLEKAAWYLKREIERISKTIESSGLSLCYQCKRERCQGTREVVKYIEACDCCRNGPLKENL